MAHKSSPHVFLGQLHHSFQLGRTNSSLLVSTSDSSSLRSHGGTPTLWRTLGCAGATGSYPARTPLTDHTGTSALNVSGGVNMAEAVFLIPLFLQQQVALQRPQPLVPL